MCLFTIALAQPAIAGEDASLAALAATLASLPRGGDEFTPSRGARPELTTAKHQLRDWIEGELRGLDASAVASNADPTADRLNEKLRQAGLDDIASLHVWRYHHIIVINTSFPIACGSDDSVYAWVWSGTKWSRALAYEKTDYAQKRYSPQAIDGLEGVHFAPVSAGSERYIYVLTTAVGTWCSSGWLGRRFQLHRVDVKTATSNLLVNRELDAFVLEGDRGATLSSRRLTITYTASTMDLRSNPFRTRIEVYQLRDGTVAQISRAAASAEDFTEQWLVRPWEKSASAIVPSRHASLGAWHRRLHPYLERGVGAWSSFASAVRCRENSRIWQYGAIFGHLKKGVTPMDAMDAAQSYHQVPTPGEPAGSYNVVRDAYVLTRILPRFIDPEVVYFVAHEDAPNIFTMIDVRTTPRRDCPLPTD